jgi:stage II sporulation protein D
MLLMSCARFAYVEVRRGYKSLKQPYVRVRIMVADELAVGCKGPFDIFCEHAAGGSTDYFSNSDIVVRCKGSLLSAEDVEGLPLENDLVRIVVVPRDYKHRVLIDGKGFRGVADLMVESGQISVINAVNMEDYLKGVLPPEIGKHGEPELEALKAQAVASRTYALSRLRVNPAKSYDMVNDVADQIYTGVSKEDKWINRAVERTRGEVLYSEGGLITAYYHSTCGGATDNIEDIWDKHARSYLKGVADSDFCQWSKFYNWSFTWTPKELEESVLRHLRSTGRYSGTSIGIKDIRIVDRLKSGRVRVIEIVTDQGKFLVIKDKIRWALRRPDVEDAILPSTNFYLTIDRDESGNITSITAKGYGNGHGVGMCQCGALGRSRAGQKYDQILSVYYRDAQLVKLY